MIKLKTELGDFTVKTKFTEFTVKEFNDIINIVTNNNNDYLETYINILSYLKVPEEIIDSIEPEAIIEIIKEFNIVEDIGDTHIHKHLEIDGYTYEAYSGDNFKLTVRMSSKIEQIVKAHKDNFIAPVMAYIYKRTDLTEAEHNDLAHYNYKIELFNNINADKCIALFMLIFEKLIKKIHLING